MRKLATIQKIADLQPIENADKIEVASILGWKAVVKKGDFKIGDLCAYAEIDSVFPDKPEFEFLRPRKFRIKTMRLRGQISQGLAMPLSYLPVGDYNLGDDVTELMGITQWIPQIPADLKGLIKGPFPAWMAKTDETRVQVLQDVLTRHKGVLCYITEKIDGTSVTYALKDGEFHVCSKNIDLLESETNAYWKWARANKVEEKLKEYGKNIAIQGELFGQGIQNNNYKMPDRNVLFFNAFDIDKFQYMNYSDFVETITQLGFQTMPVLDEQFILTDNIDELIKLSTGKSIINPKTWREGIVIRPKAELFDFKMSQGFGNGRVSFKAINPEYLIEYE